MHVAGAVVVVAGPDVERRRVRWQRGGAGCCGGGLCGRRLRVGVDRAPGILPVVVGPDTVRLTGFEVLGAGTVIRAQRRVHLEEKLRGNLLAHANGDAGVGLLGNMPVAAVARRARRHGDTLGRRSKFAVVAVAVLGHDVALKVDANLGVAKERAEADCASVRGADCVHVCTVDIHPAVVLPHVADADVGERDDPDLNVGAGRVALHLVDARAGRRDTELGARGDWVLGAAGGECVLVGEVEGCGRDVPRQRNIVACNFGLGSIPFTHMAGIVPGCVGVDAVRDGCVLAQLAVAVDIVQLALEMRIKGGIIGLLHDCKTLDVAVGA